MLDCLYVVVGALQAHNNHYYYDTFPIALFGYCHGCDPLYGKIPLAMKLMLSSMVCASYKPLTDSDLWSLSKLIHHG